MSIGMVRFRTFRTILWGRHLNFRVSFQTDRPTIHQMDALSKLKGGMFTTMMEKYRPHLELYILSNYGDRVGSKIDNPMEYLYGDELIIPPSETYRYAFFTFQATFDPNGLELMSVNESFTEVGIKGLHLRLSSSQ